MSLITKSVLELFDDIDDIDVVDVLAVLAVRSDVIDIIDILGTVDDAGCLGCRGTTRYRKQRHTADIENRLNPRYTKLIAALDSICPCVVISSAPDDGRLVYSVMPQ